MIRKTYKYKLSPSKAQGRLLDQTVDTCRRWYNACLAERKTAWKTEQRSVRKFEQLAQVKDYRKENLYAAQVHSHILQVVAADLDKAFQAFFRRVAAGETPGYPRFKGRNRFDSFGLKEYGNGFKLDGRRLKISGIGRIRVRWHRPIDGRIKTVRIRRQAEGWYACFACEVTEHPLPSTGNVVGIDVGIHHLLATSENEVVENPRWYRAEQQKLRVIQRRVSRRKIGGSNRRKVVLELQRQHFHIANRRKDYLDKLVYHFITNYDVIALEDLQIQEMVRNHHLSKSILDAGWGYLKTHLVRKAVEAGREVVLVDPAYTSKCDSKSRYRLSSVLEKRLDLPSHRQYPMGKCGKVTNRMKHPDNGSSVERTGNQPAREGSLYKHQGGGGARVDRMVSKCELSINVVSRNKPKMLIGLSQKAMWRV